MTAKITDNIVHCPSFKYIIVAGDKGRLRISDIVPKQCRDKKSISTISTKLIIDNAAHRATHDCLAQQRTLLYDCHCLHDQ